MCNPLVLPAAVAAAAVAAQALGSITGGYATSAAAKANAQISLQNASTAEQNAIWAGQEGEAQAGMQGMKNRATAGSIRADQGASGIDVNTGTNADVQASQAALGQLDVMNIRSNAARRAYGFATEATGHRAQAEIDRTAGKNAIKAGYMGAATNALSTLAGQSRNGTYDAWGSYNSKSALNADSLNDYGPHDNSLPWRNQGTS